jgi:hypothetical protein
LMPELTPEPDSTDGESQKKKLYFSLALYIYTRNELKFYTSNSMTLDTF